MKSSWMSKSPRKLVLVKTINLICLLIPVAVMLVTLFPQKETLPPNVSLTVNGTTIHDDFISQYNYDDPRLLNHIRKFYLLPPSALPYNLANPHKWDWSQKGQTKIVDRLLKSRRNGFFVEAGAYDGETYSNTLYFEKYLNWTGLLVEPSKGNFQALHAKNRKSWLVPGCVYEGRTPQKMEFLDALDVGGVARDFGTLRELLTRLWRPVRVERVWCFPLQSLLLAIRQKTVDYIVLDTEGSELEIMKTIPLDQLSVDILQAEYGVFRGIYWELTQTDEKKRKMLEYMSEYAPQLSNHVSVWIDLIFSRSTPNRGE